jgi:cyanophycinase
MPDRQGPLVIIGGHEDREGDRRILREVAGLLDGGVLLVCAAASKVPGEYIDGYRAAFAGLGVSIRELTAESTAEVADDARGVFFTGGSQKRLSEAVRGTEAERIVHRVRAEGGVIAGTSAGASVMSDTMLTRGRGETTPGRHDIGFSAGLGLLTGVLIDQHFAERGRIGRLALAVRTRPDLLGIGIDEDTAIVVADGRVTVVGAGGVYVVDGSDVEPRDALALRLFAAGDTFDLRGAAVEVLGG